MRLPATMRPRLFAQVFQAVNFRAYGTGMGRVGSSARNRSDRSAIYLQHDAGMAARSICPREPKQANHDSRSGTGGIDAGYRPAAAPDTRDDLGSGALSATSGLW